MPGPSRWLQVGSNAAERYERELVPGMFASWAPILVDAVALQPGDRVLDVACGTGAVTRVVADRLAGTGRIVGLDINAAMLGVARGVIERAGSSAEWCEASALEMPLPDASFDVVVCQQGLQQFPDRAAALGECSRVLRPGGRLALAVWASIDRSPGFVALVAALERHVSAAAADNRRAPFALGEAAEVEGLVRGAGFEDVTSETHTGLAAFPSVSAFVAAQLAASPLATLGAITDETVAAVVADLEAVLVSYVGPTGLAFPMQSHLVAARR